MKKVIKKVFLTIKDFLLKVLLKWRKRLTISSAVVGLGLAWLVLKFKVTEWFFCSVGADILTELKKGLFLIVLAAPTSYYLWFLRNEDKLVQLEQQKENNQFNSFSMALRLFTEKGNMEANAVGLKLLMKMRYMNKVFDEQIDLATPGKNLEGAKLSGADLTKVKLMGATLIEAKLDGANLTGADLKNTELTGADLTNAILTDAILTDAYLTRAILTGTNLTDAKIVGSWFYISKRDLPNDNDEIDHEFFKKNFRAGYNPENSRPVKIIEREGKYYLEKIENKK